MTELKQNAYALFVALALVAAAWSATGKTHGTIMSPTSYRPTTRLAPILAPRLAHTLNLTAERG